MLAATLAGALLGSLTIMGVSRKIFGHEAVSQRLVPHRADIGVATFFNIGVGVSVELGLLSIAYGPGGDKHLVPAMLAQLGYLSSLVARQDLPPQHPHRLVLLLVVWIGLVIGTARVQLLVEVTSLWIVKLRVNLNPAESGDSSSLRASTVETVAAPFIKGPTQSKVKGSTESPTKSKTKAPGARKGGRPKR